jgi:hypothetical protein
VQVEHTDYGRRIIVAGETGVDEHDDGEDSRDEHNGDDHNGEADAGDDPEPKCEWQWSRELAVVNLCPLLLHNLGKHERSASARFLYRGGEQVHFSGLAALAEHWANMYLTNPPCKEVIAQMRYQDNITGRKRYNILADRTIYCESGITIASLMDVLHMQGDVKTTKATGPVDLSIDEVKLEVQKNTTLSREMNRLRASGGFPGYPVGKLDLNTVKTLIKFPNVVFRERRAESRGYYVPLNRKQVSGVCRRGSIAWLIESTQNRAGES